MQQLAAADEPSPDRGGVKALELRLQTLVRQEGRGIKELKELKLANGSLQEQIDALRDRYADVTSDMSREKMALAKLMQDNAGSDSDEDTAELQLLSYRDAASTLNSVFKASLKRKLTEPAFVEKLAERRALKNQATHCRVLFGDESAEWKVHDPRDGAELTFGALLEDVSRYWGVEVGDFALVDEAMRLWPLGAFVRDEIAAAAGPIAVRMQRRPAAVELADFDVEYEEDEEDSDEEE